MQLSYRFRQWLAVFITLSLTLLQPSTSIGFGGDVVYDPANYAQNALAAARSLQSNINEAMEIANQLHQIELEAKNLVSLPQAAWDSVQTDLQNIRNLSQSTSGISYALQRLSTQFKEMYPGYQTPTDYEKEYEDRANNTLKTINDAASAALQQQQNFQVEKSSTQNIVTSGANAEGHMQALQTGNLLSAQLVSQLQELRLLQMAEMTAQNSYMATQLQGQAAEKAALKAWLDSAKNHRPIN